MDRITWGRYETVILEVPPGSSAVKHFHIECYLTLSKTGLKDWRIESVYDLDTGEDCTELARQNEPLLNLTGEKLHAKFR